MWLVMVGACEMFMAPRSAAARIKRRAKAGQARRYGGARAPKLVRTNDRQESDRSGEMRAGMAHDD